MTKKSGKKQKQKPGSALMKAINAKNSGRKIMHKSTLYSTDLQDGSNWTKATLQSVTEETSLAEFMSTAELAGAEFKAEKLNYKIIKAEDYEAALSKDEIRKIKNFHKENKNMLRIPRKPAWSKDTTPEQFHQMEEEDFLNWRRSLALFLEEHNVEMTPYEKQLEFWRQLWKTIERSKIVVQIVDARNPLLFLCEDLESYTKEVSEDKINLLLVNKADFLTESQRKCWADYFTSINVKAVFFSATAVTPDTTADNDKSSNVETPEEESEGEETVNTPADDLAHKVKNLEINVEKTAEKLNELLSKFVIQEEESKEECKKDNFNSSDILSPDQLLELFRNIYPGPGAPIVGFIGYPNVGKSSTLNSLLKMKKVSTSRTAGKTKYMQTHYCGDIELCDCPGLVMPSFVFTKADLVLNGILRVDEMRDHVPPVKLLTQLIPRHVFEDTYNIMIPKQDEDSEEPPTPEELLNAYAVMRGYMTANGQPDNPRTSRYILKDYQIGKLLYCHAPPNVEQESFHTWPERQRNLPKHIPPSKLRAMKPYNPIDDIRRQHFGVGVMGVKGDLHHYLGPGEHPWKHYNKHANKNKRMKLRNVYGYLDQH